MQRKGDASIHRSSTQSGLAELEEGDIPNPEDKHESICPWATSPLSCNFHHLQAFGMLKHRQAITFVLLPDLAPCARCARLPGFRQRAEVDSALPLALSKQTRASTRSNASSFNQYRYHFSAVEPPHTA